MKSRTVGLARAIPEPILGNTLSVRPPVCGAENPTLPAGDELICAWTSGDAYDVVVDAQLLAAKAMSEGCNVQRPVAYSVRRPEHVIDVVFWSSPRAAYGANWAGRITLGARLADDGLAKN
jgi:hypothetical protein